MAKILDKLTDKFAAATSKLATSNSGLISGIAELTPQGRIYKLAVKIAIGIIIAICIILVIISAVLFQQQKIKEAIFVGGFAVLFGGFTLWFHWFRYSPVKIPKIGASESDWSIDGGYTGESYDSLKDHRIEDIDIDEDRLDNIDNVYTEFEPDLWDEYQFQDKHD